jgi:outer membrane protein, multidrug efflux system
VKQAEALQQAALESYENAILSAFSDVENALVSRQKLSDQLKAQEALVRALKEYDRLAWLQYNGAIRLTSQYSTPRRSFFPPSSHIPRERPRCWQRLSTSTKPWEVDG